MFRKCLFSVVRTIVVMAFLSSSAWAALLQDSSFELATTGGLVSNSAWTLTANMPDGAGLAAQFASFPSTGKDGTNIVWFKSFEGEQNPGDAAAQAELMQMVNLGPGTYDLSFLVGREANFMADQAFIEISSDAGDMQTLDLFTIPVGSLSTHSINGFVASAGTTKLTVRAVMVDGIEAGANPQSLLLDNFVLTGTQIPEPSAAALLGGGLAAFAWVRRRRRVC